MTQTNTPKPGPRPDRAPSFPKGSVGTIAGETGSGPGNEVHANASGVAPAGDISVVTVSDAQDRTSAGSLPAVGGTVHQGILQQAQAQAPTTAAMPVVTAGQVSVAASGAGQTGAAAGQTGAATADTGTAEPAGAAAPEPAPVEDMKDLPGRRERPQGPEPASALTADRLLTRTAAPPVSGWRRWLYQATLGYVNLGDSDQVRIQRAMEHRIAMRLGERTRYVPVLEP